MSGTSGKRSMTRRDPGPVVAGAARALSAVALALLVLGGCGPRFEREAPAELLGRWTTAHPTYADRSLRVGREELGLGVGDGREELHPLEGVERLGADQGGASFRLHYRDRQGTPESLDLELRFGAPEVMRLPHIDADWIRANAAPGA